MKPNPSSDASAALSILPDDRWNREMVARVHPVDWVPPTPARRYNLVVIGGGPAGLVSALGAAGLGARVALVEKGFLGGDCLVAGCVPSKAVLSAAHEAHVRGDGGGEVFSAAMERLRRLRAGISVYDAATHLRDAGVDVFFGAGRFVARDAVEVEGTTLRFARAAIATGARASLPPIEGLADIGAMTNEELFELTELPPRLLVLGAGPIGSEMAQAFARLGSEVTLVDMADRVLPREDPDASAVLGEQLAAEGVRLVLGASVLSARREGDERRLRVRVGDSEMTLCGDQLLVAAGRAPNVDGLELDVAGVEFDRKGIKVDDRLRSTNRRVYAAGDVASKYHFTHAADALARILLRNALFFGRARASKLVVPWVTYTSPEVAHVGMTAEDAAADPRVTTLTVGMDTVDRAILEGTGAGFGRVHVDKSGRVVGASIVSQHAGEAISEMALAVTHKMPLSHIGTTLHPYPTQAEVWKKLADAWNRTRMTPFVAKVFRKLLKWLRR